APLEQGLALIAAHADSPRLDFKQHPLVEQAGVVQAKTHYYGGIRKYQWLARPLSLHGVIIREDGERVEVSIGEKPGEPVFCIADLLPHLAQKQAGQKLSEAFEAEKLNIILGHAPDAATGRSRRSDEGRNDDGLKDALLGLLHKKYGIREEDLITAELEAVPAGAARFVGFDSALLGGYGQDDRICVFAALEALLTAEDKAPRPLAVIFWDKEEIGSDGATGAASRFFQYCVEDLAAAWAPGVSASHVLLNSRALSADVQAALDPDFQEVHEKQNAALIGHGPCFSKFTGSRGKYGASEADAEFFAELRGILNARKIPWQAAELGKVDLGGGGTVALFLAAYVMRVIDLGPSLLSMN
ncbi:MAG: aminopeptidase, partial [Desulfovibrio sp.]|nr:aminopeptidase [Desulfovibrio sp.]